MELSSSSSSSSSFLNHHNHHHRLHRQQQQHKIRYIFHHHDNHHLPITMIVKMIMMIMMMMMIIIIIPTSDAHIHENFLPKGWGDVQPVIIIGGDGAKTISTLAAAKPPPPQQQQNNNNIDARVKIVETTILNNNNVTDVVDDDKMNKLSSPSPSLSSSTVGIDKDPIKIEELFEPLTDGTVVPATVKTKIKTSNPSLSSSQPPPPPPPPIRQFVWRVYNFSDLLCCSGQELIFSPRFYLYENNGEIFVDNNNNNANDYVRDNGGGGGGSNGGDAHTFGYRLQLLLVPNTTYIDQLSYLGVFFRIVAGDYDGTVEWPYKYRTVLSVLDHGQLSTEDSDRQSVKSSSLSMFNNNSSSSSNTYAIHLSSPILWAEYNYTVMPNIDECRLRSAFLRPNSDVDTSVATDGCGSRRHMPLSLLEGDRYLRDDTLLILISVHLINDNNNGNNDEMYRNPSSPSYSPAGEYRKAITMMRYNELVSNYIWPIAQFTKRERESAQTGRIAILSSDPFYTHPNGYLLQMFLTILPKRNAFAISIAFIQGDHDRYLQWPFPYSFEMAIVDHSPDYWKRDLTIKVNPSRSECGTEVFSQPAPEPEFCFLTIQSLQVLSLTHYNFLHNDTLRIRFTTKFERYSARQRASILLRDGRLVSEFNWFLPGLIARFERYLQESSSSNNGNGGDTTTSTTTRSSATTTTDIPITRSASNAARRTHKFVSDEFYTNGQGYLCQLVLTVTIKSVPIDTPSSSSSTSSSPNITSSSSLPSSRIYLRQHQKLHHHQYHQSSHPYRYQHYGHQEVSSSVPPQQQQQQPQPQPQTQDVLVFGLELVIIEGEYDRFLEWPFNAPYELSIVGYRQNLAPFGTTSQQQSLLNISSTTDNGGKDSGSEASSSSGLYLYNIMNNVGINHHRPSLSTNKKATPASSSTTTTTTTIVVQPNDQISNGQCLKESFQKPIERNPPCGVREFVLFGGSDSTSTSTSRSTTKNSSTDNNEQHRQQHRQAYHQRYQYSRFHQDHHHQDSGVPLLKHHRVVSSSSTLELINTGGGNGGGGKSLLSSSSDSKQSDEDLHLRVRIHL